MEYIRAVLRRASVERDMRGDEHARDTAIELFLSELGELYTPRLIRTLADDILADMYEDWVCALPYLNAEQRIAAMIAEWHPCYLPFLIYRQTHAKAATPTDPAPNVISLHTR